MKKPKQMKNQSQFGQNEESYFYKIPENANLSPRQRAFIRLSLESGESIEKVLKRLNLKRQTYYYWRRTNPSFVEHFTEAQYHFRSTLYSHMPSMVENAYRLIEEEILEGAITPENRIQKTIMAMEWLVASNHLQKIKSFKEIREEAEQTVEKIMKAIEEYSKNK